MNIDLVPYSIEIAVAVLVLVMVIADSALELEEKSALWGTGTVGLLAILLGSFWLPTRAPHVGESWALDAFALYFKQFFLLASVFSLLAVKAYAPRYRHGEGELYTQTILAALGGMILASARDWIPLFLGLELMTITLFSMVAWSRRDPKSLEAATKYLIIGTFSSAFLLYGIAFLYGYAGTTNLGYLHEYLGVMSGQLTLGVIFGLVLVLTGVAFKMAAFPFHVWAPDVYEGAPTPVTGFLNVASKGAGFVLGMRLLLEVFGPVSFDMRFATGDGVVVVPLIALLAALTLSYGSLAAIPQWNIKRLMGYSSISHAGYLLIGLALVGDVATRTFGATAVCFYLLSYLFTSFGAFLVLSSLDRYAGDYEMESLAGLGRRSPLLGVTLTLSLLSLAGIPPLGGFFGKFLLLLGAFRAGMVWLAVVGMVMVVVSMYVYLNVLKQIYAVEPVDETEVTVDGWVSIGCVVCCVGMVVIGVFQAPFYAAAEQAASSLFLLAR